MSKRLLPLYVIIGWALAIAPASAQWFDFRMGQGWYPREAPAYMPAPPMAQYHSERWRPGRAPQYIGPPPYANVPRHGPCARPFRGYDRAGRPVYTTECN